MDGSGSWTTGAGPQRVAQAEITDGHQVRYGSSGEGHRARSANEKIQAGDNEHPGGDEETAGRRIGAKHWLMTSVVCHEPADPMCYIGLARGRSAPPSNPRTERRRRCAQFRPAVERPVVGSRAGRIMNAGRSPASGSARSATAVKPLRGSSAPRFLRSAPALRVTAAADRAGELLAGQPKGWPSLEHEDAQRCVPLVALNRCSSGFA